MKKIYIFLAVLVINLELTTQNSFAQQGDFLWAKSFGGTNYDYGYSITTDASGNVLTTGTFRGTVDFDPGAGVFNLISTGFSDVFISKLDASGNFLWAKRMGGTGIDKGYSIATDASGNVFTTGSFEGTADFDPGAGVFNLTSVGNEDIFIIKLDASGNFLWAKAINGTNEYGNTITTDFSGNIFKIGFFQDTVDFDLGAGIFNLTSAGLEDIFILKLDALGNFLWAKQMGGTGNDYGKSICIDVTGNILTTGSFEGTVDFDTDTGVFDLTSFFFADVFISKLDSSGNFLWAKKIGGSGTDKSYSITTDNSSNILTTGYFKLTVDFDPGIDIFNLTSFGESDVFISKLDPFGNFLWTKSIGGIYEDIGNAITTDASGNVLTIGSFEGTADFDPSSEVFNLTSEGVDDIFISKLDSSGNFLWAKRIGGTSYDYGYSITMDAFGNLFTTGSFRGTVDFDPGAGYLNLTSTGSFSDVFISKYKMCSSAYVPICLVTIDSTSTKNEIIWEKPVTNSIESFNIYKETTDAGIYNIIKNVPYNSISVLTDTASNPDIKSDRYKISVIDTCGNESPLSEAHKTMHLTANLGINQSIILNWEEYEGFNYGTFYIHRNQNANGWELIDSLQSNLFTYTDYPAISGNIKYFIEIKSPQPCIIEAKAVTNNTSRSNDDEEPIIVGIAKVSQTGKLSIYPNPYDESTTIEFPNSNKSSVSISVMDITGKKVFETKTTNSKYEFSKKDLQKGVYFVKIAGGEVMYGKMVVK